MTTIIVDLLATVGFITIICWLSIPFESKGKKAMRFYITRMLVRLHLLSGISVDRMKIVIAGDVLADMREAA